MTANGLRRWKLWHLAALVLVAALICGLLRAFEWFGALGLVVFAPFVPCLYWFGVVSLLAAWDLGAKWGRRVARRMIDGRSIQGGPIGWVVVGAGLMVSVAIRSAVVMVFLIVFAFVLTLLLSIPLLVP